MTITSPASWDHVFCYGPNLRVMSRIPSGSVNLVILDPPHNMDKANNIIFTHNNIPPEASLRAYNNAWTWVRSASTWAWPSTDELLLAITKNRVVPRSAVDLITSNVGNQQTDALASIVSMASVLFETYRVLDDSGAVALICHNHTNPWLLVMLESLFQYQHKNIWLTNIAQNDVLQGAKRPGHSFCEVIVFTKGDIKTYNPEFKPFDPKKFKLNPVTNKRYRVTPLTGRTGSKVDAREYSPFTPSPVLEEFSGELQWTGGPARPVSVKEADFLDKMAKDKVRHTKNGLLKIISEDESPGIPLSDVWDDISAQLGTEKLGYKTQKPTLLFARIIQQLTNIGDTVLDPFSGGGTTMEAAHALERRSISIEVTHLAVGVLRRRFEKLPESCRPNYDVRGYPADLPSWAFLAETDWPGFQARMVQAAGGTLDLDASDRALKGTDGGQDGWWNPLDGKNIIASVKGGREVKKDWPATHAGHLNIHNACGGVLLMAGNATTRMLELAASQKKFQFKGRDYYVIQIISAKDIDTGKRPNLPEEAFQP